YRDRRSAQRGNRHDQRDVPLSRHGGAPGKAEAVPEQRNGALVGSVPTLGRSTIPVVPWPANMALLDRPTLTSGVNGNPVRAVTMLPTHQPRRNFAANRSELMFGR